MNYSAGDILRKYLVDRNILLLPPTSSDWAGYCNAMPEDGDKAVTIFDTQGRMDGREQRSGETISHSGVQFRVRAMNSVDSYDKIQELVEAVDVIHNADVVMFDSTAYVINAVTRTSDPTHLGEEPERRRTIWVFNAILTITKGA